MDTKSKPNVKSTKVCIFCKSKDENPLYGEFRQLGEITTHFFCMLLSDKIMQSGKDSSGIDGFLKTDIMAEIERGSIISCSFCHKVGATLSCHQKSCRMKFHLPCSIANGSGHVFKNSFPSYCKSHRPVQKVPPQILNDADLICIACYCSIDFQAERNDVIWMSCCQKRAVMHRYCAQQNAFNAGYELKCPNCSNRDKFRALMEMNGVFTPDRDASWEREPNAYIELLSLPDMCAADHCQAPQRNLNRSNTLWELLTCWRCGTVIIHRACAHLSLLQTIFTCDTCYAAMQTPVPQAILAGKPCCAETCVCPEGRHAVKTEGVYRMVNCADCTLFNVHLACVKEGTVWYCHSHQVNAPNYTSCGVSPPKRSKSEPTDGI